MIFLALRGLTGFRVYGLGLREFSIELFGFEDPKP